MKNKILEKLLNGLMFIMQSNSSDNCVHCYDIASKHYDKNKKLCLWRLDCLRCNYKA